MASAPKSLRAIFDEASELEPGEERQRYLDRACAGDVALRANVEELLRAQETVGGFLADPKPETTAANTQVAEQAGDRIGRYKLLQKIGEGGCGVVYMAEQLEPVRRRVALKIIKLGMDTRSVIARFEAERQALALMDHPSIAQVFDAGTTDGGRPFFVMELVRGTRITDFCDENHFSTKQRLHLFTQVCQAVQHAHQKGIIHRDLKPSNILVTSNDGVPLPKVIDFGIAKATADVELTDKTLFTRFEMFIGTPAYMSPEQAELNARGVDTRTDVYSLGVLLYELLTGTTPFDTTELLASGLDEMRRTIREVEPVKPSTRLTREIAAGAKRSADSKTAAPMGNGRYKEIIHALRGDLDWIVLKSLEKDRARRYQTPADFGADIQRHLDNEPVIACPPSRLYLLRKLIRRNRPAFAVASCVAVLLMAAMVFGAWDISRTRQAERAQRALRQQAEHARIESDAANQQLTRELFIRKWEDAEHFLDEGKAAPALAWFAHAARTHPTDVAVQTRLLSILTEGCFALPAHDPLTNDSPLINASFSSDEQQLITAGEDGNVRLWPLNVPGGPRTLPQHFSRPAVAAVSPGNRVFVEDEDTLSLWELNGALVKSVPLRHHVVGRLTATPDRRFVALHGAGGIPQLWNPTELEPIGQPVQDFNPSSLSSDLLAVSPDGRYLVGKGNDARICAWEVSSGHRVWHLNWNVDGEIGSVTALAVHPDGKRVVVARRVQLDVWELQVWDFAPNEQGNDAIAEPSSPQFTLANHSAFTTLSISRDGEHIFAGDDRGHMRSGDFTTPELRVLSSQHDGQILWHGLSADGWRLATASVEGTARLWDLHMNPPELRVFTNGTLMLDAKFSPDSRWFACGGSQAVDIRDTASGELLHRLPINDAVTYIDISRDGRRIVACAHDGATRVWDTETGQAITEMIQSYPWDDVAFSPDGRCFLVKSDNNVVQFRETETGRPGMTFTNVARVMNAQFSPDGRRLAVATVRGELALWSLPDGRRLDLRERHKDIIWTARFSPNSHWLLTASRDRTAALWDAETGRRVREFRHDHEVYNGAFSPDSSRIITGDGSGRSHVWDAESGAQLFTLMPHPAEVWYGEYSPDGRWILTGDTGRLRLWDAESGLPVSGWLGSGLKLKRAHFSPDGHYCMSAVNDGTLHLWPVIIAPLPVLPLLPDLAEAVAGYRYRDDGRLELVPVERWQSLTASLSSLKGDDFYARWVRWFLVERMKPRPQAFGK